jgi:6-phosphogluconolactonase/glucosamine-6-phosphate isomerase/deaminase
MSSVVDELNIRFHDGCLELPVAMKDAQLLGVGFDSHVAFFSGSSGFRVGQCSRV